MLGKSHGTALITAGPWGGKKGQEPATYLIPPRPIPINIGRVRRSGSRQKRHEPPKGCGDDVNNLKKGSLSGFICKNGVTRKVRNQLKQWNTMGVCLPTLS